MLQQSAVSKFLNGNNTCMSVWHNSEFFKERARTIGVSMNHARHARPEGCNILF